MAKSQKEIKTELLAMGVPEEVIDYALSKNPSNLIYHALNWAFIFVMVVGFAVGGVLWVVTETAVEKTIFHQAIKKSALLYDYNFGISMVIALFAWIIIAGVIMMFIQREYLKLRVSSFVFGLLHPNGKPYGMRAITSERVKSCSDPDAYIKQALSYFIPIFLWPGLFLAALSVYAMDREFKGYELFSTHGYYSSPFLPWNSERTIQWQGAQSVELGCNHVTGRNASDDIVYRVILPSKGTVSLAQAAPVDLTWLDQIETIDTVLEGYEIPFKRWQWRDRDPLHPACLNAWKRKYTSDQYARLEKLLRIDELGPGKTGN